MRKPLIVIAFLLTTVLGVGGYYYYKFNRNQVKVLPQNTEAIAHRYAKKLKVAIAANKFNSQYCFIVNLAVPSKFARFYIYDLNKNSIVDKGLVTHGKGSDTDTGFQFSNVVNSGSSSKGMYKIGAKYYGKFGLAYKLHGLESTNSKAFERFVVLHSHACVPSGQSYISNICRSDGCPTVAPNFLTKLAALIDASKKPIMLYIDFAKN